MAFSHREGVAGEDDGYVVMPAAEFAALVVVEAEFSFEVLVGALSAPALRGDGDQGIERRVLGQRREVVVGRVGLAVAPLDEKPDRRTLFSALQN
jgi:hypothetical protein